MLQELASLTGAATWAIGSMLFFLAVWVGVAVWVVRRRADEMAALARLPLEGDEGPQGEAQAGAGRRAI